MFQWILLLAGANISQELSTLKVNNLYDAETAYKELTESMTALGRIKIDTWQG